MTFSEKNWIPLSERLRPEAFDDIVGQPHLTGERGIIRKAVESARLFSMILYGPPGTGKTTIGRIISGLLPPEYEIVFFSASLQGTADLKKIFSRAEQLKRHRRQLVLFVDEIHRLNKAQQDVFLPVVESGTIVLIGATTENPSFEINPALLSRCRLVIFRQLSSRDILQLLETALARDTMLKDMGIEVGETVLDVISENSGGDARIALNLLDTLCDSAYAMNRPLLDLELMNELSTLPTGRYSKKGEEHYDLASAFIKSIRGSDPDAALYYMHRMLESGEDPKFLARRMVILASEDIGLADPMALLVAVAAFEAVEKVGLPECALNLSEAAIYLSISPKSNRVYLAMSDAKETVKSTVNEPVPLHLRNPVTDMMKKLDYGKGYVYPHNTGGFYERYYLPDRIKSKVFYKPSDIGKEKSVKERLKRLWKQLKKYDQNETAD